MKPGVNGKILLVVDTDGRKDVERRTFSFMFEHQDEGIIYSKWVHGSITPPADQEGGYGAAAQVLATGATGVFCHNDRTALGLYDALRESGKRMPDDISVVGFDNQEVISAHMHPALTTVGLPQYDLGVMGVRTLLRRCGADNDESEIVSERFKPVHVQCPAVPRDSVRTL